MRDCFFVIVPFRGNTFCRNKDEPDKYCQALIEVLGGGSGEPSFKKVPPKKTKNSIYPQAIKQRADRLLSARFLVRIGGKAQDGALLGVLR